MQITYTVMATKRCQIMPAEDWRHGCLTTCWLTPPSHCLDCLTWISLLFSCLAFHCEMLI